MWTIVKAFLIFGPIAALLSYMNCILGRRADDEAEKTTRRMAGIIRADRELLDQDDIKVIAIPQEPVPEACDKTDCTRLS